ncbi:haloacid dehalogenase-like hydrolase [Nocardiopsis sp. EMB25]|uniref:HAD family hydrolase n=1 Tax=Nocardiopsis sp. EMB25 TaxID=2835867 RepID=UPI0022833C2F|nr:HAD hydrolase-like protein [Nocardiopsis sp. EMB25]MCY9784961.1 haloacid dehalogenase-like hydrolase [Nocardiopsis sp. EMB25]
MTPSLTNRLILWDIDHTLLSIGPVSREIYAVAFETVTGSRQTAMVDMAGRTEHAIIRDTLKLNGHEPNDDLVDSFYDALGQAALGLTDRMVSQGRALPGGREAIKAIGEAGGTQSLVTGNIRSIALAKLQAFGLYEGLELDTGGYGDHSSDRARLVEFAIAQTSAVIGTTFSPSATVVIGDTPNDVHGAHTAGAYVVAVATGHSSRAELLDAGADAALEDLRDTRHLLQVIAQLTGSPAED